MDSIKSIQLRYDSLSEAYRKASQKLSSTKELMQKFRGEIDSIMKLNIYSANRINHSLKILIEDQKQLELTCMTIKMLSIRL